MKNNKASILLIALWILFLLASFVIVLNAYVQPNMQVLNKIMHRTKTYYLAQAGFKRAVIEVGADKTNLVDGKNESWYLNENIFKQIKMEDGLYDVYSKLDNKDLRYGLTDEESKINIALVSENILSNLFEFLGGLNKLPAQDLVKAVVDYRKQHGFYYLAEVLMVRNFDKQLYDQLKNKITIYGEGKVNVNTASREVLKCIGFNDALVEKIIIYRQGLDAKEATEDDIVFSSETLIADSLNKREVLSPEEINTINNLIGMQLLTVVSNNFSGWIKSALQKEIVNIYFVFDRIGKIKSWRVLYKDEIL